MQICMFLVLFHGFKRPAIACTKVVIDDASVVEDNLEAAANKHSYTDNL